MILVYLSALQLLQDPLAATHFPSAASRLNQNLDTGRPRLLALNEGGEGAQGRALLLGVEYGPPVRADNAPAKKLQKTSS